MNSNVVYTITIYFIETDEIYQLRDLKGWKKKALNIATTEAKKSKFTDFKVGCYIYGKKIRYSGYNILRGRVMKQNVTSIHAEANCAKKLLSSKHVYRYIRYNTNATAFVVRLRKDVMYGLSKPCKNCQKTLYLIGVKKVYYTDYHSGKHIIRSMMRVLN